MLERIPQDKTALRAALVDHIAAFEAARQVTVCPPCRTAWQYYAVCTGNSKDDEDSLILKRTKGDPIEAVKAHRSKMETKREALKGHKLEANALGRIAYAQAIAAGASVLEGKRARNAALREHMKAKKTEKAVGDTRETTNNTLFNGGRTAYKAILAMKTESASSDTLLTPSPLSSLTTMSSLTTTSKGTKE